MYINVKAKRCLHLTDYEIVEAQTYTKKSLKTEGFSDSFIFYSKRF
jgi:phage FluMu protein Com